MDLDEWEELLDEASTLDEVVVDYELAEEPEPGTERIEEEELRRSGAETLAELLEERAAMQVFSAVRGSGLRLRGLEPEHVLFLVDGMRLIGRLDGTLDLSRFQLEDYSSVDIIRGSSSALYGSDAIGGVVNLIPRDPRKGWTTSARGTYGYQDRHRSNPRERFEGGPRIDDDGTQLPRDGYGGTYDFIGRLGYGGDRGGFEVHGGVHQLDAYDLDPRNVATDSPESLTWDIGGSGAIVLPRDGRLRLRATYLHRDDEALEERGRTVVRRLNRTEQSQVIAVFTQPIGNGRLSIRAAAGSFRDQFVRRVRGGGQMGDATDTRQAIGQLRLRYVHAFSARHVTTIGYDSALERMSSPRLSTDGKRARLAPYLQHEWLPTDSVAITPGLRFDADSAFGSALSPKLAIRIDAHERVRFRLSGGRGFRAPGFRELLLQFTQNASLGYIVSGNPDLRAEHSWGLDGTGEVDLVRTDDRRLTLVATAHWTRVRDLITTDLIDTNDGISSYGYVNVGDARTAGLESELRLAIQEPGWRVDLDFGYTRLHSRDLQTDDELPGRSRDQASLRATFDHRESGVGVRLRTLLAGARSFSGDDGRVRSEPYLTVDVRLEKSLGERLGVFAGVDNLLNNGGIYLTTRPRTYWVGLSAHRPARGGAPEN
ncbi:MAG: TonB-dependent receptor [Deltaproteobacteria bacterium]|nr:TonB-dependent receptor [Deltaproteobacteria bacterium]